jgi:deoxyribodipyrimidine photolyase-related protein
MARTTVWILGTQLSPTISSLAGVSRAESVVLMIESVQRCRQLPYHQQKLTLVWSAMRHFAAELRRRGWRVDYYAAEPDFESALASHLKLHEPDRLVLMEDAEYGVSEGLTQLARRHGARVSLTPHNLMLSDRQAFAQQAEGKKQLLLEGFYRRLRRQTGLLLENGQPVGGRWNLDAENRRPPPAGHTYPTLPSFRPDATTRAVQAEVKRHFPGHFGQLSGFNWPVTRRQAESLWADFLDHRLDLFGPYEDAMVSGQASLYHSLISPALNLGLLDPLKLCHQVEERYHAGLVRLSSAEGFIRQIIGWREFIYQVYHYAMPRYAESNYFGAELPLPDFYWTADTDMNCLRECVQGLLARGHNHHIQRLMVTGNFALLAGLRPQEVNDWYWLAFVDAYGWVVTPNVLGLALYADGGLLATKPYAASARYLERMSDYCRECRYDHKSALGVTACPFNALYWDFLQRHRGQLAGNPRLNLMLSLLDRKPPEELAALQRQATGLREQLAGGGRL